MKQSDLHNLLALGEGFTTEFKCSGTSDLGSGIMRIRNLGRTVLDAWELQR